MKQCNCNSEYPTFTTNNKSVNCGGDIGKPKELFEGQNSSLFKAFQGVLAKEPLNKSVKPNNQLRDVTKKVLKPNKSKELSMIHKQPSVSLNKKSDTQPKELDWEIEFEKINLCGCSRICFGHKELAKQLKDFIQSLLTQQRTELLEEIKKLELKHSINPNSPSRERKIIYNEAIKDVINLINKKDETK